MKTSIYTLFIICTSVCAQQVPCYKKKPICDFKKVKNCNELVAFDEYSSTYYSRKMTSEVFNGTCVSCYRNGVIETQIKIVNGKQDSIGMSYYESGCPQSKMSFILGIMDGPTIFYYDSTNKKESEQNFNMGKKEGKFVLFQNNEKSDTIKLETYKNDKLDGSKKDFFENGKVKRIVFYKEGLQDGNHKQFNEEGKVIVDINYKEGKNHGTWTYYFDDGKIANIQNWNKGVKNGEFKTMDNEGLILKQEFFKKGIPDGKHIENFEDGNPKHVTQFLKGEIIEEYSFDTYGVRTDIVKMNEKNKKTQEKSKTEDDNPEEIVNEKKDKKKKKNKKEKKKKD
ncbi:MAG: toxin-antitoxin system YwqK family antitoxin [Bacteroidetes bacterium]|nr:toxin-antitoxin system YwqK family antitoxin [Bacteroidota bacterium]